MNEKSVVATLKGFLKQSLIVCLVIKFEIICDYDNAYDAYYDIYNDEHDDHDDDSWLR